MKEWGREREEGEGVGERERRGRERERETETDHLSGVLKFHLLLQYTLLLYSIISEIMYSTCAVHVQYMCMCP